jgi:hypothetical protein
MGTESEDQIAAALRKQVAPAMHIPDIVRVGVIACTDEDGLRLQGHLMACEGCREPLIALVPQRTALPLTRPAEISCAKARDAMCRYLEGGDQPDDAAFAHVTSCDLCDDLFFEPAKALILREYEPEHVGEVD